MSDTALTTGTSSGIGIEFTQSVPEYGYKAMNYKAMKK